MAKTKWIRVFLASAILPNEGRKFRELVEFAFALGQVSILEEHDIQKICRGLRLTRNEFENKRTEYRLLLVRAEHLGIRDLPELK